MSDAAVDDVPASDVTSTPKKRHTVRWLSLGVVLAGVGGAGVFAWRQAEPVLSARKYSTVTYEVPKAEQLEPADGETVYRIDPTRSSLTYEIDEKFAGKKASTATGVTNGIAGDLAIDADDLSKTRVGDIAVNVEQFHSDNNLRDARLRQDFLESHAHPLATFAVDEVEGLDGKLEVGKRYDLTLTGSVTLKDTTAEATFAATASIDDDGTLTATATTKAKLSRFDAGPISIAGLVTTSDDVDLTLELTALDPTEHTIPSTITGPDAKEPDPADAPSYAEVIAPILSANCASCHNTGQMGADHVTLDDAGDVQAISDGIKTVTQSRYMPPWPASDVGVPLAHETTLSDEELVALAAWSDAGGPLDVEASTKLTPPKATTEAQPRQDLVLAHEPYTGSLVNNNDYRCFVLDPKLTEAQYLTGYTFLPDQVEELHHAQVFHISAEQLANADKKDGKDGRPGWSCYSGPNLRGTRPQTVPGRTFKRDAGFPGQANLVAGWVPGQSPVIFPEQSGILMQPGDALVIQLHYHYNGEPTADASALALQLDPSTAPVKAVRVVNPLGPVEIPCLPEDQDEPLCDRDAALADNVELYGPSGANNEAGLLMLCGTSPEELTKDLAPGTGATSCDLQVPEDGTIIGAMGHMHTLGTTFRLTLDADTDDPTVLLDIPTWSFDWQMNYELATPIHVEAGQNLRMDCTWDRASDPTRPPKYIVFAEGTEDEMCFGTYSLIPDDQ